MTHGAFIDASRARWEAAAQAAQRVIEDDFLLAGRRLRLRFAGEAMRGPLTAALAHARRPVEGAADLTVLVWDRDSTGVSMPPAPWPAESYGPRGRITGWFDADVQVTYHPASSSLSVLEPHRGRALFWSRDADAFPFFERAAPLRALLHGWLSAIGLQLAHAAAVSGARDCALIAGASGAGKSSTTLACLDAGLGHLADDFCVLDDGTPATAHALYSSVKAHDDTLARLAVDPALVANPGRERDDKAVVFLAAHRPEVLIDRAPVGAILAPEIHDRPDTRLTPATAGQALRALIPSTILQFPGADAQAMRRLSALVRAVPCFRLELGTDPGQIAARVAEAVR